MLTQYARLSTTSVLLDFRPVYATTFRMSKDLPCRFTPPRTHKGHRIRTRSLIVFLLPILILLIGTLRSQSLEKTIPFSSIGAYLESPWLLAFDSISNTLYTTEEDGDCVLAIDCATHQRIGLVPAEVSCALFSVPGLNRVYCDDFDGITAIDTKTNTVVAQIPACVDGGGCNPATGKVYFVDDDTLLVVEGRNGHLLHRLYVGEPDFESYFMPFACNTVNDKIYLYTFDWNEYRNSLVVVDGRNDSVSARIDFGCYAYLDAMCYDDLNNLFWCALENDSCTLLLALDGVTDSVVAEIPICDDVVEWLCFDRADNKIYCYDYGDGYIIPVDIASQRVLCPLYADCETPACINEREHKLYYADEECCSILIYDSRDDSWLQEIPGCEWPTALTYNPLENEVYCADGEMAGIAVIDGELDYLTAMVGTSAYPEEACIDPRGERLFITGLDPGAVDIITYKEDLTSSRVRVSTEVNAICYNPAEQKLFIGAEDTLTVVDATTLQVTDRLLMSAEMLFLDSIDNEIYCVEDWDRVVTVVAGNGIGKLNTIELCLKPVHACYDSRNQRLYLAGHGNSGIEVVDCSSDGVMGELPTEAGYHRFVSVVPEEKRLYYGNEHSLSIYDTDSTELLCLMELNDRPSGICYDPVGQKVFCSTESSGIYVLDPGADTVVTHIPIQEGIRAIGCSQTSNLVYWVGDSMVGFIDPRRLELTETINMPDLVPLPADYLWYEIPLPVCDENRIYFFGLPAVYVVRDAEPEFVAQGKTGPTLVGRNVSLLGAKDATLVDAVGRKVMTLHPGRNRLVGLAPGAYFVLREGDPKAQKVVLLR